MKCLNHFSNFLSCHTLFNIIHQKLVLVCIPMRQDLELGLRLIISVGHPLRILFSTCLIKLPLKLFNKCAIYQWFIHNFLELVSLRKSLLTTCRLLIFLAYFLRFFLISNCVPETNIDCWSIVKLLVEIIQTLITLTRSDAVAIRFKELISIWMRLRQISVIFLETHLGLIKSRYAISIGRTATIHWHFWRARSLKHGLVTLMDGLMSRHQRIYVE